MFWVVGKYSGVQRLVYAVRVGENGTEFLFFDYEWTWCYANEYEPQEVE